jgi:hypothetical protein
MDERLDEVGERVPEHVKKNRGDRASVFENDDAGSEAGSSTPERADGASSDS